MGKAKPNEALITKQEFISASMVIAALMTVSSKIKGGFTRSVFLLAAGAGMYSLGDCHIVNKEEDPPRNFFTSALASLGLYASAEKKEKLERTFYNSKYCQNQTFVGPAVARIIVGANVGASKFWEFVGPEDPEEVKPDPAVEQLLEMAAKVFKK